MEKSLYYESDAIILIALCLYGSSFNGPKKEKNKTNMTRIHPQLSGLIEELGSKPSTQRELPAAK